MRSARRPRLPAAIVSAALALVPGCTDDGSGPSSTTASTPADRPPATAAPGGAFAGIPDLVEAVEPSIVAVLTDAGQGSGVVWSADGVIVTNDHVVARARRIEVAFADGRRSAAELEATDPQTDLAVLRTDRSDLPAATFAESLPRVGESVIAIGNPLGLENTVTAGIISGVGRAVPGAAQGAPALVDLLQTDAAISPGNSGGALVATDGSIVGINVAYLPPSTGAESLGFAIPAPTVRDVVEELLERGEVRHAFLGIRSAPMTPDIARRFGTSVDRGLLVLDVTVGSPAEEAGLLPGDVLVRGDDAELVTGEDLLALLRSRDPGDRLELTVVRDEQETIEVTLGERP